MTLVACVAFTALVTYALIAALLPWLRRRALAQVVQRSSHTVPTPQGAGLAVIFVAVAAWVLLWLNAPWAARAPAPSPRRIAGAAGLSIVGFLDDTRGLPVRIRLAAQALAVLALVAFLPADLRVIPGKICPLAVERVLLAFASLWFINLFNFMDGIDWISCVEVMTVAGGIGGLWMAGIISGLVGPAALLLAGAMAGFGVWNRPRARIFLGDAGSLALGLLLAWLMIETAAQGAWAAALLFSLYYWADATLTLLLRLARRDKVWVAHREHFYQQATRPGRSSVPAALVRIGGLNATLVGLGFAAELSGSTAWRFCAVGLGCGLVTVLLWVLADRRTAR